MYQEVGVTHGTEGAGPALLPLQSSSMGGLYSTGKGIGKGIEQERGGDQLRPRNDHAP